MYGDRGYCHCKLAVVEVLDSICDDAQTFWLSTEHLHRATHIPRSHTDLARRELNGLLILGRTIRQDLRQLILAIWLESHLYRLNLPVSQFIQLGLHQIYRVRYRYQHNFSSFLEG